MLLAFAAFTKFIPDILALCAVADKNRNKWRFHEGLPISGKTLAHN
jgi:hypothetical protein